VADVVLPPADLPIVEVVEVAEPPAVVVEEATPEPVVPDGIDLDAADERDEGGIVDATVIVDAEIVAEAQPAAEATAELQPVEIATTAPALQTTAAVELTTTDEER
jgi:hypothetical protein